jgi:hypothetical protein
MDSKFIEMFYHFKSDFLRKNPQIPFLALPGHKEGEIKYKRDTYRYIREPASQEISIYLLMYTNIPTFCQKLAPQLKLILLFSDNFKHDLKGKILTVFRTIRSVFTGMKARGPYLVWKLFKRMARADASAPPPHYH